MASSPVVDKFLHAIETATIPACEVWSTDAAHHMHVLTVRDDLIVADTVFCGGRWPASLLAEMEAANA